MPLVDWPLAQLREYRPPLTREPDFDALWERTWQGPWKCQRAVVTGPWLSIRTYHPGLHPFPDARHRQRGERCRLVKQRAHEERGATLGAL